jgi:ribonuclease P/MRP protein subunit RPP40
VVYKITGILLDWFKSSFFLERRQRAILGECVSDWFSVLSGVPQGSVLGSLLFILLNDLSECVNCECKIYVDDSKLISVVKGGLVGLQDYLNSVKN